MRVALSFVVCIWISYGWGLPEVHGQSFLVPLVGHHAGRSLVKLERHKVHVTIKGRMAHTTIEQVYHNPTARQLEAHYLFALPPGAVVSRLAMTIDGKVTKGRVYTRTKAIKIYQDIVRKMRDPALLEYMGRSIYRVRIFPIPAHSRQVYKLSFVQLIARSGRLRWYNYPMRPLGQQLRTTKAMVLVLKLQTQQPLKMIYSPTHRVSIHRKGQRKAVIGFEQNKALFKRDFRLYFSVAKDAIGLSALYHRHKERRGYAMLALSPGMIARSSFRSPKQVTFVVDTSGSMGEEKRMFWARRTIQHCLTRLDRRDTFNVIGFSTDVEPLFRQPKRATPKALKKGHAFAEHLVASGGTALEPALRMALQQTIPQGHSHLILVLTDGDPTVGQTTTQGVLASIHKANKDRKARIFTFGLGTDINVRLLDQLAARHGGVSEYISHGFALKQRALHFFHKISHPILRDIRIELKGPLRLYDQYPKSLPDVYRGEQMLVFARIKGHGRGTLVVTGWLGKQRKRYTYPLQLPQRSLSHSFVQLLWARRKMGYLLGAMRNKPGNKELKKAVVALAEKYQLVTPVTSMLLTPPSASTWATRKRAAIKPSTPTTSTGYGTLSPISRQLRSLMMRQLKRVLERNLKRNPHVTAKLSIDLTIGKDGRPTHVEIHHGGTSNALARHVKRLARRWRFARPQGGKATLSIPVVFSTTDSWRGYRAKKGKQAIKSSKRLWSLKHSRYLPANGARIIKGRRFVQEGIGWREAGCSRATRHIYLRYKGSLYFKLLQRKPALAPYLALGARVTLCAGPRKQIHIGASQTENRLSRLLRFLR